MSDHRSPKISAFRMPVSSAQSTTGRWCEWQAASSAPASSTERKKFRPDGSE
jgi:hypothetical protein